MLENIALIASVISAITAVTTSLRALGRSRENMTDHNVSKLKTSCRTGCFKSTGNTDRSSSLLIHLISTVIWFILAIIFAVPAVTDYSAKGLFLLALPFLFLLMIILLIWRKALRFRA